MALDLRDSGAAAVRPGETIQNHRTGETLTLLSSHPVLYYQVRLLPHSPRPPLHYHVNFTETFAVAEGTLSLYLDREQRRVLLGAGESVTVAIGRPHTIANESSSATIIRVETQPPTGVLLAYELAYGVANEGGASADGLPKNPFLRMRVVELSQGFLVGPPLAFQQAVLRAAILFSQLSGLEKRVQAHLT